MPALRASDSPIMSANENRFHSWLSGPHQNVPSVSTPSTSSAMALIGTRCSHAAQLVNDRLLPLEHPLHSIAHGLFDQPDITNQSRDAVRLKRRSVVRSPHRAVHCDVPL